jgi:flagellar biosynthesis anti-sigma factor FlgM
MVIKINDTRTINQPAVYGTTGQVSDAVPANADASTSSSNPVAEPAATIDLSSAVHASRESVSSSSQDSVDSALLQEIRQRIQNGTYQINHGQIAENLLRDAVLATRR